MSWLKRNGFLILLIGIISDFITPYVLGLFYPGFNSLTMYVSELGSSDSPVELAFNVWSIISGTIMLLGIPAVWSKFHKSTPVLALLLSLAIAFFAIGDCIFTGIFTFSDQTSGFNLELAIHTFASGAGIIGFMVFPLLLSIFYAKRNPKRAKILFVVFLLSTIISIISGSADLPLINQIPVTYEGVWQRLNLFFLYFPVAFFAIAELRKKE